MDPVHVIQNSSMAKGLQENRRLRASPLENDIGSNPAKIAVARVPVGRVGGSQLMLDSNIKRWQTVRRSISCIFAYMSKE